jgi:hypothetical protein
MGKLGFVYILLKLAPAFLSSYPSLLVKRCYFNSISTIGSISHLQPGPRDGLIQCFIKRDKSKLTYHLYLSLTSGTLI